MIYGYARVSTAIQDFTAQRRQLTKAGCEKNSCEKITGTHATRLRLRRLLVALPGDVVITPAVDRTLRDTAELLVIARRMEEAGADLRSLAEPFVDTTGRAHPRSIMPRISSQPGLSRSRHISGVGGGIDSDFGRRINDGGYWPSELQMVLR